MNRKFHFVRSAAMACMGLMLIFSLSCSDTKQPDTARRTTDKAAPDFALKNLSGQNFKLSSQKGKSVLLIFITTWCPTCRSEIPHYRNIYEAYAKRSLEVAMIDIQESRETVSRFASKHQIPFTVLLDERGDVAGSYGIVGVPAMVLLDKDGNVLSRKYMAIDMLLETTLGEK
ncbi:MAG: TlpA disulfide reductase family protein [Deltaproteobacteria bacterium]|nr:TlpA disulfide reductase family protein [Deltaproteobacteria bacterium]